MKKISTFIATVFVAFLSQAQVVTFETLTLPTSNYWKGNPGVAANTTFYDVNVAFTNRNDTSSFGDYWSGWAYSAKQDTTSIDYATNDIAAITGIGQDSSNAYGVAYLSFDANLNRITFPSQFTLVKGLHITNTTIAYRSMQNGDFAAKKFGGITGNDPDFFRIDFTGSQGGVNKPDTVRFYLADFRDSNNNNDYIVKDWRFVDLTILGNIDALHYNLVSTDTGSFGMNTPAYFCIDSLAFAIFQDVEEIAQDDNIRIFPNPMNDYLTIENSSSTSYDASLISMTGQILFSTTIDQYQTKKVDVNLLPKGMYSLQLGNGEKLFYKKVIK